MDGQQIRLRQRVLYLKDFRKIVHGAVSTLQSKPGLVFETSRGVNTDRDAFALVLALRHGFDIFEITYGPGKKLFVYFFGSG